MEQNLICYIKFNSIEKYDDRTNDACLLFESHKVITPSEDRSSDEKASLKAH
jgi:hypothetical protein